MNVKLIPEESYREAMEQTVLPYLCLMSHFSAKSSIHCKIAPSVRGNAQ